MINKNVKQIFTYFGWFLMVLISVYAALAQTATAENAAYAYPSFNMTIDNSYWVCQDSEKVIFPELTNYADFEDSFTIKIQGNDFTGLTVKNIDLPAMAKTQIPVVISPKDEGLFDLKVMAEDIYGYFTSADAVVYVDTCVDRVLDIKKRAVKMVNCEKGSYPIILSNNGAEARTYDIDFIGPEWTKLDLGGSVKLEPGQYKSFNMDIDVPCDVKGNFEAEITVKVPGDKLENKQRVDIEVYGKNEAYKAGPWHSHPLMLIPKIIVSLAVLIFIVSVLKKPVGKFLVWSKKKGEERKVKRDEKKKIRAEKKAAKKLAHEIKVKEAVAEGRPIPSKKKWVILGIIVAVIAAAVVFFNKITFPFILQYKYYLVAGFVLLALIIVILSAVKRAKRKKELKAKGESVPKEKRKARWVNGIGAGFLLIIIIGAAVFSYFGNPFVKEAENEFLKVDAQNVVMRNGRVIAKGDSVIPLIVDDKNGEAKFSIDSKIDWIKVDNSELSTSKDVKRIYLYVTPNEQAANQNYLIDINAFIDYNNQSINENIQIEIINTQEFAGTYMSYIAGGIIFGIIITLVVALTRKIIKRKKGKKAKGDVFTFDPKTMKASDMLQSQKKPLIEGLKKGREKIRKGMQHYVAVELREKLV